MSDNSQFLITLRDKYNDLLNKIWKKKLTLLVPMKKYIIPDMLNQTFYDNHIFYICPSDPTIYINLNAKALKYEEPVFTGYLGWKKEISFRFKEKVFFDFGAPYGTLEYICIDNVCDESNFNSTVASSLQDSKSTTTIKSFATSDEYIRYYNNFAQGNTEYREAEKELQKFANLMKNNIIFMKGQEVSYYCNFQGKIIPIFELFKTALSKVKMDENLLMVIVYELVESLLFTKYGMHDMLMKNLKTFFEDEEKIMSDKLKETKNEYNLAFLLGPQYKDCQFSEGVAKLKDLSNYKTHFEKARVLKEINDLMKQIAKESCFKLSQSELITDFEVDTILTFWMNLYSQCNWTHLIAELNFVFNLNLFEHQFGEIQCLLTHVFNSLNKIKSDIMKNEKGQSRTITQTYIELES